MIPIDSRHNHRKIVMPETSMDTMRPILLASLLLASLMNIGNTELKTMGIGYFVIF